MLSITLRCALGGYQLLNQLVHSTHPIFTSIDILCVVAPMGLAGRKNLTPGIKLMAPTFPFVI